MTRHAGETLETVSPSHFGQARSVWAKDQFFGILGGQGDPRAIREHFWLLKKQHARLDVGETRSLVRQRIGKIMGGSAVLWVGGATEAEIAVRKDLAERAAEAIRGAMLQGVVPGGGMPFLACKPALKRAMQSAESADELSAYRILYQAMDLPLQTIAANAGLNPADVMAELKYAGEGCGYDVRKMRVVPIQQTDVLDSAGVALQAAYRSAYGAALLLTVDALVHHQKPETVVEP
jgi:chaperonin GroEL